MTIARDDAVFFKWSIMELKTRMNWIVVHLYRLMDVPSKLIIYALLWHAEAEFIVSFFVIGDFLVIILLYYSIKSLDRDEGNNDMPTDALLIPVATPLSFGQGRGFTVIFCWIWGLAQTVVLFTCLLAEWKDIVDGHLLTFIVAAFASSGITMRWIILFYLQFCREADQSLMDLMDVNKERSDLKLLLGSGHWEDALELILFKKFNISAAVKCQYIAL